MLDNAVIDFAHDNARKSGGLRRVYAWRLLWTLARYQIIDILSVLKDGACRALGQPEHKGRHSVRVRGPVPAFTFVPAWITAAGTGPCLWSDGTEPLSALLLSRRR